MWLSEKDERFLSMKSKISELERQVERFKNLLLVDDYFKDCPSGTMIEMLPKHEAKSFRTVNYNCYSAIFVKDGKVYPPKSIYTHYTSEKNYEIHKAEIEKWEKEAKDFEKSLNKK